MATLQAALGEQDLALVSLEKAFAERNGGLIWLGADQEWTACDRIRVSRLSSSGSVFRRDPGLVCAFQDHGLAQSFNSLRKRVATTIAETSRLLFPSFRFCILLRGIW